MLAGSPVLLGAQDAHWETAGAFTGCVSPAQIWDAGARVVILGHSERRHGLGETDDVVRRKVTAALMQGLTPLVCVGETADERAAERTLEVVTRQLDAALGDRPAVEIGRCWRAALGRRAGMALAAACPILYGGSVKPEVTSALMTAPDIDGALVGGASLKAADFIAIVRAGLEAKGRAGAPAR